MVLFIALSDQMFCSYEGLCSNTIIACTSTLHKYVHGSSPTLMHVQSSLVALSEVSTNARRTLEKFA